MADLMRRLADKATVKLQGLERLLCAHQNALALHHLEACQVPPPPKNENSRAPGILMAYSTCDPCT